MMIIFLLFCYILAAEAAARQRRIQERLEIARGKRKKSAVNEERPTEANTLRKKDVLRKADEISASERKLKPNPTSNEASKTSKSGSSSEARKADTKCKIKIAADSGTPEANKTLSSKSSKSASSKDVPSLSNNKQKDIKSKDSQNDVMEKSGTSKIKSKTSKFKAGNKASLSFSDLMKVAKGQADKPVTAAKPKSKPQSNTVTDNVETERRDVPHKNNSERKTTKREKDSSSKERLKESSSTSRKGTVTADTLKTENRSHKTEPRIKGKDISSVSSTTNLKGVSAKGSSGSSSRDNKVVNSVSKTKTDYSKVSSSASSGSQLITQTVSNRLSYAPVQRRLSGEFKQQKVRNGDKSDARGIAAQSRTNTKKIDKELERERLELERQRRLLQMKMRKGKGFDEEEDMYDDDYGYDLDDDYDDDDDFIDDDGDDMDYSRHIRQIFGYDKRK